MFPEQPREAVGFAIAGSAGDKPLGVMIMGVNPRREFDDSYRWV